MKFPKLILLFSILFSAQAFGQTSQRNAYQFSFNGVDGRSINLSDFRGKVIFVVNTASKCGFTPQYKSLEELHKKYQKDGLVVIGVPSNDFGSQELANENQVKDFTKKEFGITFTLTSITKLSGPEAHPFYLWANQQAGFAGSPKWNFHKFLIDKNGNFVDWFSSPTDPMSEKVASKIESLLAR